LRKKKTGDSRQNTRRKKEKGKNQLRKHPSGIETTTAFHRQAKVGKHERQDTLARPASAELEASSPQRKFRQD
jgi:hypothetical protein